MTVLYPIVLEIEANGTVSAYVPGLPVYAAAETAAKAERAIRSLLTAYLGAHRSATKARASRTNGRLGGRPRKAETATRSRVKASR